jgi:hypothetical protein
MSDESKLTNPSEGWWACQRQMQDSLSGRYSVLSEKREKLLLEGKQLEATFMAVEMEITDRLRRHLKNTLLWDTGRGE